MGSRKRTIGAVIGVAALIAAGVGAGVAHADQVSAAIPPASASPEQVVRVYLRAAKAHDCAVTEALTVSSGDARSMAWCGHRVQSIFSNHPDLLAYRNIRDTSRVPADETGGTVEDCIPVDITETNMSGAEPGEMDGWQFCFIRTPSGWRVADEGYG